MENNIRKDLASLRPFRQERRAERQTDLSACPSARGADRPVICPSAYTLQIPIASPSAKAPGACGESTRSPSILCPAPVPCPVPGDGEARAEVVVEGWEPGQAGLAVTLVCTGWVPSGRAGQTDMGSGARPREEEAGSGIHRGTWLFINSSLTQRCRRGFSRKAGIIES